MQTRLWIILLVVVAWIGFLLGYSVSALTGPAAPAAEVKAKPAAGGYAGGGEEAKAGAGGYGARPERPRRAPSGGYGGSARDD